MNHRRIIAVIISVVMLATAFVSCGESDFEETTDVTTTPVISKDQYPSMTPEEIVANLTLEQKAAQMVQPAVYCVSVDDMRNNDYGSILSTQGSIGAAEWRELVDGYQQAALESETGIPYIYGQDDVHGVNYCLNAVYFPHSIGVGAANDEDLCYQMGLITADEAKLCHMLWNFSPVIAQSVDPRWGRTYESYGSDLDLITRLSTSYTRGLIDGGLIACAKHFLGDGNVVFGTGEADMLIDRGDAQLSDAQIDELLAVYQAQIDAGVQTIMVSHSALNGVKMHENGEYIMRLKNEMGFEGFIVSDWNSVQNTSASTYEEQVINGVNAGIDMLMEIDRFEEARQIIVNAVNNGDIAEERVDDAVTRIIKVKKDAGIFDDPLCENLETVQQETGSMEYRAVAEKLVEKSLVLLKNDSDVLPLQEGTKVYITGPAADNGQAQCGGWTISWNSSPSKNIDGVTTIREAFEWYAQDYGIEVITDPEHASEADVVLLCVGEQAYAEWNGDTEDLELCGSLGLAGNREAIQEAASLGKPVVTLIVAGRHVILDPDDVSGWDSVVMCYLPGSEGKGISDVLCGCADFTGRLPSPWYGSVDQIGTDDCVFDIGYGLSYPDGFAPRQEPEPLEEEPEVTELDHFQIVAQGTDYTQGLFKDNVYVSDYAGIAINIPAGLTSLSYNTLVGGFDGIEDGEDDIYKSIGMAEIVDAVFNNSSTLLEIDFINTDLYGHPEYSADDMMDDFLTRTEMNVEAASGEYNGLDRTTVEICGEEYVRMTYDVSAHNMVFKDAHYIKRIDDNMILHIYFTSSNPEMNAEAFEAMFIGQ